MLGDMAPVHDPSIMRRADGSYIVYTTDLPFLNSPHFIAQRCSADLVTWAPCGYVFDTMPAWVTAQFPDAVGIWAPDISFFGGSYHLYYSVSTLGSQHSALGVATNVTLDPADPRYKWVDGGEVLASSAGADFNAIDPNVLVDSGSASTHGQKHVWLSYGSFWGGIYQQELDPSTGQLLPGSTRYNLATQPASLNNAIEGAAMVAHNGWYYLFASIGICCSIPIEQDTYRQILGRSRSVHGPFLAQDGKDMLQGGGTVLLTSDENWLAPGGGSLWQSADGSQTLLTFHALQRSQNGALDLWVEQVTWQNDWPVLQPLS
jgi:arabinan endo-1,5-alpha-L-arabinosidase